MIVVRSICRVLTVLCMIFVAALMILMIAEVLRRSIFNRSILGATEWAQVLLVCNMSAFAAAVLANRQIKVNIITSRLSVKKQVIVEIVTLTLTFITVSVLSWQQFLYSFKSFNSNVFYANINLPQWPFVALFAASYGVAALTILLLIVRKIMSAVKGEWEKEAALEDMDEIFVYGKKRVQAMKEKKADSEGGETNES